MTISNTAAATLDLSTRIAWARIDVARGTATPEELLAIIEDIQTGRDEEMIDLRRITDREIEDMRKEVRDAEGKTSHAERQSAQFEEALDEVVDLVRRAAGTSERGAFDQLYADVKAVMRNL